MRQQVNLERCVISIENGNAGDVFSLAHFFPSRNCTFLLLISPLKSDSHDEH